jgi:hypothetical protein
VSLPPLAADTKTAPTPPRSPGLVKQMVSYSGEPHRNLDPTPLVGVGEADSLLQMFVTTDDLIDHRGKLEGLWYTRGGRL